MGDCNGVEERVRSRPIADVGFYIECKIGSSWRHAGKAETESQSESMKSTVLACLKEAVDAERERIAEASPLVPIECVLRDCHRFMCPAHKQFAAAVREGQSRSLAP